MAWRLATQENEEEWLAFLTVLENMGIRGENGLELIIHDGGSGLCAALNTIYFGSAYHSDAGLQAMVTHEVCTFGTTKQHA